MPLARPTPEDIAAAVEAYERLGTFAKAGAELGLPATTVQHRVRSQARVPPPPECRRAATIEPANPSETPNTSPQPSERERMLSDENRRLKSELARKTRGEERLVLEVRDALAALDVRPFNLPPTIPGPLSLREREHLILLFSDTQIGKRTPGYDLAVAEARTMEIARRFLRVAEVRSEHADIAGVTIYFAGDAVEGEQIYAGQAWHVECGVGPQSTKHGPEIHAKLALTIAEQMPRPVRIRCVAGNHGRVGAINLPSSPTTNWDRVCYESTRLMLDAFAPGAFDFALAEDWYMVDRHAGGWGVMLTHGDMIGGGGTSAAIVGAASGWAETIPEPWDYLMMGHFHKPWHLQTRGGTRDVFVNGSTETDDSDFVRGRMKAGGRPCQRMFVLTEERGIIEAPVLYPERRVPMGAQR